MLWLLGLIAMLIAVLIWRVTAEAHALRGALHGETGRLLSQLDQMDERLNSIEHDTSQLPKVRQPGDS